jgi:hypothetical protein
VMGCLVECAETFLCSIACFAAHLSIKIPTME